MIFKNKLFKIINLLDADQKKNLYILLLLILIGTFSEILSIGMIVPFFGLIFNEDIFDEFQFFNNLKNYFGDPDQNTLIYFGILGLFSIYVVKNLFLSFLAWRQTSFIFNIIHDFANKLLTLYLFQPYSFHLKKNSSELIRNIMNEVDLFATSVISPLMVLITESLVVVGLMVLLLYVEPVGVLGIFGMISFAALVFLLITKKYVGIWGQLRQYHAGFRVQHLQQGIGSAKELKLMGREYGFLKKFFDHNRRYTDAAKLQNTLLLFPRLWLEVVAISSLLILIYILLQRNENFDDIYMRLAVFVAAVLRLLPSANRIVGSANALRYGVPSIDVIKKEFKLPFHKSNEANPSALSFLDKIEIKSLTFKYEKSAKPVLNDVSFVINKGESVGLVGTSGAGKSTLIDLLLGLLTPNRGLVYVDGINVQKDLRSWQNQIGYVPQSIYLTDDTLRNNIAFGIAEDKIDHKLIEEAICSTQLEEFAAELPKGLDTYVGEQGVRLSGGQRQRIGIARALYHNPDILVLDEATSSLDIKTESGVMDAIEALHGKKTIIIVTHRMSTISHCDHIYLIEGGKIKKEH